LRSILRPIDLDGRRIRFAGIIQREIKISYCASTRSRVGDFWCFLGLAAN
jgi:hypothetical protein